MSPGKASRPGGRRSRRGKLAIGSGAVAFGGERLSVVTPRPTRHHRSLLIKSVLVTIGMMVLFFAGQPVAKVAIVGGALLLFTRSVKAEKVYREVDWPLLLMFVGLFIVVTDFETSVLSPQSFTTVGRLNLETTPVLTLVTTGLSNLVSNVPAVLVLKPFIVGSSDPEHAWLVVAMASTLAGNFTLIWVSCQPHCRATRDRPGRHDRVLVLFKVGAPLTLLTLLFGIWWL
jgi:Na+/H+ antiporter NhaD/arsenite permease-like protein